MRLRLGVADMIEGGANRVCQRICGCPLWPQELGGRGDRDGRLNVRLWRRRGSGGWGRQRLGDIAGRHGGALCAGRRRRREGVGIGGLPFRADRPYERVQGSGRVK
jgi:hypothetical protein